MFGRAGFVQICELLELREPPCRWVEQGHQRARRPPVELGRLVEIDLRV
jgi:hypothetical protein